MSTMELLIGRRHHIRCGSSGEFLEWLKAQFEKFMRGCYHRKLSRPLTLNNETYCICLNCGARRQFDLKQWKMRDPYYFEKSSAATSDS